MPAAKKVVALITATSLLASQLALADTPSAPRILISERPDISVPEAAVQEHPASQGEQGAQESKFIWGLLLKLVAPAAFDLFASWVVKKIKKRQGIDNPDDAKAEDPKIELAKLVWNSASASIVSLGQYFSSDSSSGPGNTPPMSAEASHAYFGEQTLLASRDIVLVSPNATEGEPGKPLVVDKSGENFQGVNIALVEIDANGGFKGYRSVKDGFKTGERFKIRVLSTFDAVVVLGNINPKGVQKQIYPARNGKAVSIPAGKEILLPLGKDEYLQFVGDVGEDKLTFTVRDPRTLKPDLAASTQVFRKDDGLSTHFIQEVKPGRFPVIAEAIAFEHQGQRP